MTLRPRHWSSNSPWRTTATCVFITAWLVMCDSSAFARPRVWAEQDAGPNGQPSWMPFSVGDRAPNPAVARITAVDGGALSQGSGTLVAVHGERGLIVTNWHVIHEAKGPIIAAFPDGFRSAATVLKADKDWDLAALLIWRPHAVPIAISATAPRPGDILTIAGYGSGKYRAVAGRCTQYVAPGVHMPYEMVEVAAEARQGDSGGPILNERGELAGVLFGAGGGTTSGSFCGRVRWFLESAWPATRDADQDTLVSSAARQPNTHWPGDRLVAAAQEPVVPERPFVELAPNYDVGAPLVPSTVSTIQDGDSAPPIDINTLTGTTAIEHAKTTLATIGILAIFLRLTRFIGSRSTKRRRT